MKILILNSTEISSLLSMRECIDVMADALRALARDEAEAPDRTFLRLRKEIGVLGMMPGALYGNGIMGTKLLSIFPGNARKGLHTHQGVVVLFDNGNGNPLAIMDADRITALRTAAVSAVATECLASKDAGRLALLGSGVQAVGHLEAMRLVRPITDVKVWSLPADQARSFAAREANRFNLKIEAMDTADEAVRDADIVCTVTSSATPVLHGKAVKGGAHINAVGAFTPATRELDSEVVAKSRFFGDRRTSVFSESGDFLIPKGEGIIGDDHFIGEIGDVLTGKIEGRKTGKDVTVFKSLGLAIEDLAAAGFVYRKALAEKIGTFVELT